MILLELFLTFFKIGAFTFGGGYAMLPLVQREVAERGWLDAESIINFIAISESTPGPFAVNIATYVGSQVAGIPGAICATSGVVIPSFIVILLVAKFFMQFRENRIVKGCMSGLKPAVVGLIGSAVLSMALTVFVPTGFSMETMSSAAFISSVCIFILMTVLAFKKVHPIVIIILSALIGIACGYLF